MLDVVFLAVTVVLFWAAVDLHAALRPDLREDAMGWEDILGLVGDGRPALVPAAGDARSREGVTP